MHSWLVNSLINPPLCCLQKALNALLVVRVVSGRGGTCPHLSYELIVSVCYQQQQRAPWCLSCHWVFFCGAEFTVYRARQLENKPKQACTESYWGLLRGAYSATAIQSPSTGNAKDRVWDPLATKHVCIHSLMHPFHYYWFQSMHRRDRSCTEHPALQILN